MVSESFWELMFVCMHVMILEIIIDWMKHAFITRFNDINLSVYNDYLLNFAYDTAQSHDKKVNICDHLYFAQICGIYFLKTILSYRHSLITQIWWQEELD